MKYFTLDEFYVQIPQAMNLKPLMDLRGTQQAKGSNHNHQTWEGGYLHHVCETLNIAVWLYETSPRPLPFSLNDALLVMFLHDLEKPFKAQYGASWLTKEDRRDFREILIRDNNVFLTVEQWNALEYVEGVPDHKYSNQNRVMGEMAAFCHCCDILSARLWWNMGRTQSW